MGVGVVNRTLNIDSQLSELFCLSEHLDCGAGERGSDNRGWTVLQFSASVFAKTNSLYVTIYERSNSLQVSTGPSVMF